MTWWSHAAKWKSLGHAELCLWALAAKYARAHFGSLLLNTDDAGARLLVDGLGIEVDDLRLELEGFSPGLPHVWAMGKLETFRIVAEAGQPFCHIDGDAILWKALPETFLGAELFAQFSEAKLPKVYPLDILRDYFPALPPQVASAVRRGIQNAYNLGIVGGTDCEFFSRYAWDAMAIAQHPKNARAMHVHGTVLSVLLEQYTFGCYAEKRPVLSLLIDPQEDHNQRVVEENRARCSEVGFSHFWGNSKRASRNTALILNRAERELPGIVERARPLAIEDNAIILSSGYYSG